MITGIIEITSPVKLNKSYGRLQVRTETGENHYIPFDQITSVIIHPHGATITTEVLAELSIRNIPLIILDDKYQPTGLMLPVVNHHQQSKRLEQQIQMPKPLKKQLWKQIIQTKILMQAAVLDYTGNQIPARTLEQYAIRVQSGDKTNLEAQAAKLYFKNLYGPTFTRERSQPGINQQLNYGYAVIRAATARSLIATGLTLNLGLHHKNIYNPFRLADDIMEPYRPLIDLRVHTLQRTGQTEVEPITKKYLAQTLNIDTKLPNGHTTPIQQHIHQTAQNLSKIYQNPNNPPPLTLINPKDQTLLQTTGTP